MFQPFDRALSPSFNRKQLDDPRILSGDFWAELRIFLAVAKIKSFSRAAKELGVTHPTVAKGVRRLEDVMGSQLLMSSTRGVALTDRGKQLAATLVDLDERLFSLSRQMLSEKHDAEGLVRISTTEAMGGLFIVPRIPEFTEKYPNIQIHIKNSINLAHFSENQSDIAVRFLPATEATVTSKPLGFAHFIPVASAQYFSRFGMPTRDTLNQHFFLDSDYYSLTKPPWDAWRKLVARGETVHLCDHSYSYAFMVKSGLGIGLLGNFVLSDSSLIALNLDVHIRLPIFLQVETERLKAKPVRVVFDWLSEIFGPEVPWFSPKLALDSFAALSATLSQTYDGTPFESLDVPEP